MLFIIQADFVQTESRARAAPSAMGEHPGQLRLLIATDNHLGVWEDDEIRKHDSFVAFEEILQHAHRLRVDALLLGGDLFHENKPSRCSAGLRRRARGGRTPR